jgi:hypothetical protein
VTADLDVVHVVDGDPVIGLRPNVVADLGSWAAPPADQVALLVEREDGRAWLAALADRWILFETKRRGG